MASSTQDLLGFHWTTLAEWCPLGQIRGCLRFDCWRRRWVTEMGKGFYFGSHVSSGGQESTYLSIMSTFVHHGLIFVPLGYAHAFKQLTNLSEVHGSSPWGAGSFAGTDGSRQPTALELEIAEIQGAYIFCEIVVEIVLTHIYPGKNFYTTLKRWVPKGSPATSGWSPHLRPI
jgi:hypothetical protein